MSLAEASHASSPPTPPAEENKKGKENFWFLLPRPQGADEARRLVLVQISLEKSSDFVQDRQPICKVCVSRLARGFAPRFGGRIFKQFPNEPIFCPAKGGTQSDNFLPKAITNLIK
ncbi:hypothetical protein KKH46_02480 [Patescibacteria group bacterium]|nr:hypothetical protein [Patescibacteria group bacterium]MBU1956332.1 hypothetical protein [Patescibacteria group bacterium]